MCGIFCLLGNNKELCNVETFLVEFKTFETQIARRGPNCSKNVFCKSETHSLLFAASVLWLQGTEITEQPVENGNAIFIYNGDIFNSSFLAQTKINGVGDTKLFFELLQRTGSVSQTLSNIEGPYAFIYFDKINNKLYFGRDWYGRRSLLIGKYRDHIIITSVAKRGTKFNFMELPSAGIFSIDLATKTWHVFPWKRKNNNFAGKIHELETFLEENIHLSQIELQEVKQFSPPNATQLKLIDTVSSLGTGDILHQLCNSLYLDSIMKLRVLLENGVKKRILTQPKFCQNCYNNYDCDHAITGVLFSGGVDCAILALLGNEFIEERRPIDLINVAFEKDGTFQTPDRTTGLNTLTELQTLCPQRKWNFIEVNVTRQELDLYRKERISDLIFPLNSILDDSLGCALWFASRAATPSYTSPCRTLLVGMGADELFGGYTRHRAAFQKGGWSQLHEVLEEDWQNLPYRNLGRDDRVVSDHGRQLRTPYLDEKVVEFVQNLDVWHKTFPSKDLPQGIGEKILLRCLAHHLGLKSAALFKKRALQFGSRIANSKEKGHEISERLNV